MSIGLTFSVNAAENDEYRYEVTYDKTSIYIYEYLGSDAVVTIPDTIDGYPVRHIGENAFKNNQSITKVIIPDTVKSIGMYAFSDCNNLTEINIPASVTAIDEKAFYSSGALETIVVDENNETYDSRNNCNAIIVTETDSLLVGSNKTVIPDTVKAIVSSAFVNRTNLEKIIIPDSVKEIGSYAFTNCFNANEIYISDSVELIGRSAFSNCTKISEVVIPASVTKIAKSVFYGCANLDSISVDSANKVYDSRNNCNAIIETETNKLIQGCNNTIVPDSVTVIGYEAFAKMKNLKSMTIPNSVKTIEASAFYECESLSKLTIPDSVVEIKESAFFRCISLKEITIPSSIKTLEENIFRGSYNIESIVVDPNNQTFDSRNNCNAIIKTDTNSLITACKNTIIPETVTTIGSCAFAYYPLDTITIPETVTTLEAGAFLYSNNLSQITLPSNITSIRQSLFRGCTNLEEITIPASVTLIASDSFEGCDSLKKIVILAKDCEIRYPDIPSHTTIYGYTNSSAHTYASLNNLTFVPLDDVPATIMGDVDEDGFVTVLDATYIQFYQAKKVDISYAVKRVADVDNDGMVTVMDAFYIQRYCAGYDDIF